MTTCDKPAEFYGALTLSGDGFRPLPAKTIHAAFCRDCTRTPAGGHRQFTSDRPAEAGETCAVPK